MSHDRRVLVRAVWLAAVAAVVGAGPAAAQPGRPKTTLYLVLRTGADETQDGIKAALQKGIKAALVTIAGEPSVKAVSPAFVEEFLALDDRATVAAAGGDPKDGMGFRLLPSRETVYEVRVPPTQVLTEFKVTYQQAGEKKYVPAAPGEKSPLVLTVPGRYAFTPQAGDTPVSYEGTVAGLDPADPPALKGDWPRGDKHFIATMRDFVGDRQALFLALQNKRVLANPFKDVRLGNDLVFAFADLNSSIGDNPPVSIDPDNNLLVRVPTLRDLNPRRVWVYLALDEKGMGDALAQFGKIPTGTAVSTEIRKNAVTATQAATLGPTDPPKWFELPPVPIGPGIDPNEFERKIKLSGMNNLVTKYPRLWMLVVHEFDEGGGSPEAIFKKGTKSARVLVREQELTTWAGELQKALNRAPAKP